MSIPFHDDPYKALGVTKDATTAAIKSAYRKLALTCHPDKVVDESLKAQKADEFHKIQKAYELIGDEDSRHRYEAECRLNDLRKEKMERDGFAGGRGATTTSYRSGSARMYEERVPSYEPYYEEAPRSSSRKYDEYTSTKRSPPRSSRAEPLSDRDRERAKRADREREREKEERRDREKREREKSAYVYEEDAYDEDRRRKDREVPKHTARVENVEIESEYHRKMEGAKEYMSQTVRPSVTRASSGAYQVRRSRASPKESRRRGESSDRQPSERLPPGLETHRSSPARMEIPKTPQRSYTDYDRRRPEETAHPGIHRSETTPIHAYSGSSRRKDAAPTHSSKLRSYETATKPDAEVYPTIPPAQPAVATPRTRSYRYTEEDVKTSSPYTFANGHRAEIREPGRSTSPLRQSTKYSTTTPRATTYSYPEYVAAPIVTPDTKRPGVVHTSSARAAPTISVTRSPERISERTRERTREHRDKERERHYEPSSKLFGELPSDKYSSSRSKEQSVNTRKPIRKEDVVYSHLDKDRLGHLKPTLGRSHTAMV